MSDIIIAGDSFCASVGWPEKVAEKLNLELSKHGYGGHSWWRTRSSLMELPYEVINNPEVIIFCHTQAHRIPSRDDKLVRIDYNNIDNNIPEELAVKMYWTYIFSDEFRAFFDWSHEKWYQEISERWGHCKLIHLHCFPGTWKKRHLLKGMHIKQTLTSISLNELGDVSEQSLRSCGRPNHFNEHNNTALATELVRLIENYQEGEVDLDLSKFDLKSTKWFDWRGE